MQPKDLGMTNQIPQREQSHRSWFPHGEIKKAADAAYDKAAAASPPGIADLIPAFLLAFLAFEGFLNYLGWKAIPDWDKDNLEGAQFKPKLRFVCAHFGVSRDDAQVEVLREALQLRNQMSHPKPIVKKPSVTETSTFVHELDFARVEALRSAVDDLAKRLAKAGTLMTPWPTGGSAFVETFEDWDDAP